MARLALVSFRLGGTDGVAIEAAKWTWALRSLGHEVVTIAGEGDADVLMPGLAMEARFAPQLNELEETLSDVDLVIVENMISLPLNVAARDALYQVLDRRRAILHHHDLAWQRPHLAHLEGPRDQPNWLHVTINELSSEQLAARGITATTLMNSFNCDPPLGNRGRTRRALGIENETLLVMPTRAIARKNITGALQLASALDAAIWILGPSEEGYEDELLAQIAAFNARVIRGTSYSRSVHDAYAAADLVVMPSTWEGFGNPVLESVTHRRPLALYPYPVAQEIRHFGFEFFDLTDLASIQEFLNHPDDGLFERNLAIARSHFNVADLPARLATILLSAHIQ